MGLLADFYLSQDGEATRYNEVPDEFGDVLESGHISVGELSTLWAQMRGVEWSVAWVENEFVNVLFQDEGEVTIWRLPNAMTASLAACSADELSDVGAKWAATEELKGTDVESTVSFLRDLAWLARRAVETGQSIYLWNCV